MTNLHIVQTPTEMLLQLLCAARMFQPSEFVRFGTIFFIQISEMKSQWFGTNEIKNMCIYAYPTVYKRRALDLLNIAYLEAKEVLG